MGPQLWGSILKHEDLPLNSFIAHKQYSSTQYSKETTKISVFFILWTHPYQSSH